MSGAWLAAVGTWAFANGVRGILWHQLTDRDNDRVAGVRTFAQLHPPHVAARLGTYVVFPLELAGLAAMLWQMRGVWAAGFLIAYLLFAALRTYRFALHPVIVAPKPRFLIVLHEYYDLFLPVAILIQSHDWIVLAIHVVLFPNRLTNTFRDALQLWRERRRPRHSFGVR